MQSTTRFYIRPDISCLTAARKQSVVDAERLFSSDLAKFMGCMENPERQNNPDQPEQIIFCECDHVQATESQITSLL